MGRNNSFFDLQAASESIAGAGEVAAVQSMVPGQRTRLFDAEEQNALVEGDVVGDVAVRSRRSVLVRGKVSGRSGNPSHIEVRGDAVIAGAVQHARIHADNILIGGAVRHCQLVAAGDIKIGGSLSDSRLSVGDYQVSRRRVEELKRRLEGLREEKKALDRKIDRDERFMDKACRNTRMPLKCKLGKIIQHNADRIRIDLGAFYQSVGARPEEESQTALVQFFTKGIAEVLIRANRSYLEDNPARKKIFLQLLGSLKELFLLTARRDQIWQRIERCEARIEDLVDLPGRGGQLVWVGERVEPTTRLEFFLPRVERRKPRDFSFDHQRLQLEIRGADESRCALSLKDERGEEERQRLERGELQELSFFLRQGRIAWQPLPCLQG